MKLEELTERVNRGSRAKLLHKLKGLCGENTTIYAMNELPQSKKTDTRPLTLFVVDRYDCYTLTDIPTTGKTQETLIEGYARKSHFKAFLLGMNPKKFVSIHVRRAIMGRKKRELTKDEKRQIKNLRSMGKTINEIAAEMHIRNRPVMEYVRILDPEIQRKRAKKNGRSKP